MKKIHFTGIQGAGMVSAACISHDRGNQISGSDLPAKFFSLNFLTKLKIPVFSAFSAQNIIDKDVVVYTGAHGGKSNVEVVAANKLGIKTESLAEFMAAKSVEKETIAICGCHGKTTTTALTTLIGDALDLQMSYAVGGPGFLDYPPGRWFAGKYFALEADEYVVDPVEDKRPKFALYSPKHIICTNIDFDHPDVYQDLDAVKKVFIEFFQKIPLGGKLIINNDDVSSIEVAKASGKKFVTYGQGPGADYRIENINEINGGMEFTLSHEDKSFIFFTQLFGNHNVYNICSVLTLFSELGLSINNCAKTLAEFTGVKRRIEKVYEKGSLIIFDDYAHHPSEIRATVSGLKKGTQITSFPYVFNHTLFSRTEALFADFVDVFDLADETILLPIFASAREQQSEKSISSQDLVTAAQEKDNHKLFFAKDDNELKELLTKHSAEKRIVVTMGAGSVYEKKDLIISALTK